ncbi:DNA polymerase zeta [Tilletia horrida]|nr:DNA polymerase zeta [Tilletia horrida]KAK0570233.1 DNA polymerase zeta [Tilletia horrida]
MEAPASDRVKVKQKVRVEDEPTTPARTTVEQDAGDHPRTGASASSSATHSHALVQPVSVSSEPPPSTTSSYEPFFRMRLNNIDHILARPLPAFDRMTSPFAPSKRPLRHVPVLRIFGATPAGQRVCAHIHGIFPYLYVAYKGSLEPETVLKYIDKLGRQLNYALAATQSLPPEEMKHYCGIAAINLVKGTPFYGYHVGWSYFLKVSFINPRHSSRVIAILESGRVMGTTFAVHEGHIRYQLQFMLDYNLLGCGYVDFEDVLFRTPVPSADDHASLMSEPSTQSFLWNDKTIPARCLPKDAFLGGDWDSPSKSSYCSLELDASSQSVLNRRLIRPRPIHRSFGEAAHTKAHSQGNAEKLVPSLNGLWEEEVQRRKAAGLPASVPTPQTLGDERVDPHNEQRGRWQEEERLYALLDQMRRKDQAILDRNNAEADSFLNRHRMDRYILTTFESVEAFQLENVHGARKKKQWQAPPSTLIPKVSSQGARSDGAAGNHDGLRALDFAKPTDSDTSASLEAEPRLSQERFEASKVYDLLHFRSPLSSNGVEDQPCGDGAQSHSVADGQSLSGVGDNQQHPEEQMHPQPDDEQEKDQDLDVAFFSSQKFFQAMNAAEVQADQGSMLPDLETAEGLEYNPDDESEEEAIADYTGTSALSGRRNLTPSRGSKRLRGGRHPGEGAMWGSPPGSTPPSGQRPTSSSAPLSNLPVKRTADNTNNSATPRKRVVTFDATPTEALRGGYESDSTPTTPSRTKGKMSDLVLDPSPQPSPPRKILTSPWQPTSSVKTVRTRSSSSMASAGVLPPQQGPSPNNKADGSRSLNGFASSGLYAFSVPPPTRFEVINSWGFFGLPSVEYRDPLYSNPKDVPTVPKEYGGKLFRFQSVTLPYLREFRHDEAAELDLTREAVLEAKRKVAGPRNHGQDPDEAVSPSTGRNDQKVAEVQRKKPVRVGVSWQYGHPPPSRDTVMKWCLREDVTRSDERKRRQKLFQSQIAKPTPSSFGFKISQNPGAKFMHRDKQHMTVLIAEIHVCTRGDLLPDPEVDEISAIIYNFKSEGDDDDLMPASRSGVIMLRPERFHPHRLALPCDDVFVFDTELELLTTLVDVVRELDPEILAGYEIHNSSWGYIIERAAKHYEYNIIPELGRINETTIGGELNSTGWDFAMSSALRVTGRHILNIWRLMRGEMALNQYTFENVTYHLLHKRIPKFSHATLTDYYSSPHVDNFCRPLRYWLDRIQLVHDMIEASDLVFRTAEFARVYGIDFFSVINRGSQFKVESVMLRIAKPESFVLFSPTVKQREAQNAIECFPLIMEPQSAFYKGPLLVLDFQSLYPSLMIAYNICYSTCLGRVEPYKGTSRFGCTEYDPQPGALTLAKDRVHVSPNGMVYVKPDVRKSLLAKMLTEILDTRVMVKGSMKSQKDDKGFQRQQNARQLSLKLLANVTYGYTSATWSGRMPCVEIADSIVQYGRETLENSIKFIHSTPEWEAQVVYGDTDSLFISLPGRSKAEAFRIGQEISDRVTALQPRPVKLKFEKVYLPCVLLAKKRYVGYKYEALAERDGVFDAKGIETVRRDGHAALQRMLETCLRELFTSQDLTIVKQYCQRQWRKILEGNISIYDFIFAKEVRLGGYSEKGVPPPGAIVATRKMLADKRAEPQHAERVPYLISQGAPGAKLNDQAVPPEVMLQNPSLRINAMYYITRTIIPPLERVFNLLGADVASWFRDMPHSLKRSEMPAIFAGSKAPGKSTVSDHFREEVCSVCGYQSEMNICGDCRDDPNLTEHTLGARLHLVEARQAAAVQVCATCSSLPAAEESPCVNVDCPVLYSRSKIRGEVDQTRLLMTQFRDETDTGQHALIANAWEW